MGGYEGYSDEELIAMMKRGEPEIMDYLMEESGAQESQGALSHRRRWRRFDSGRDDRAF